MPSNLIFASILPIHSPVETRGLMSGILQQGYSFGYVIGACVNLKVGGAPDSWIPAFWGAAGASFVVGFVRLAFPESRQFIEAKKAGKRGEHAKAFRQEAIKAIKTEWKMISTFQYILLLSPLTFHSLLRHPHDLVQLLLSHIARLLHHLHESSERSRQRWCIPRVNSHEDWSMCRWNHHRIPFPIHW